MCADPLPETIVPEVIRRFADRSVASATCSDQTKNVENKIHWYETKYSLGGQRDIEFLEFFYNNPKYNKEIENIEEKRYFIKKAKMFSKLVNFFSVE